MRLSQRRLTTSLSLPTVDNITKSANNLIEKSERLWNKIFDKIKKQLPNLNPNQIKFVEGDDLNLVKNADGTWTMYGTDTASGTAIAVDVTSLIDPLNDDLAHVKDMLTQANKLLDKLNGKTITNWVEKFTNKFDKLIKNNADQMLQPVLLAIDKNGNVNRVSGIKSAPYEAEGEVRLEATTYTAELFAPAYVKFVGCKDITADGFNELNFSNSKVLKFTPEKGKLYEIVYEAADYSGNIKSHTYYIQGK